MQNPLTAHFKARSFACRCGAASCPYTAKKIAQMPFWGLAPRLARALASIRKEVGFGIVVTSGWRCANHPAEKKKARGGAHSVGLAVDIRQVGGSSRHGELLAAIFARYGKRGVIKGIGVAKTFTHLDVGHPRLRRPDAGIIWFY